jgi:hypothetical protein
MRVSTALIVGVYKLGRAVDQPARQLETVRAGAGGRRGGRGESASRPVGGSLEQTHGRLLHRVRGCGRDREHHRAEWRLRRTPLLIDERRAAL